MPKVCFSLKLDREKFGLSRKFSKREDNEIGSPFLPRAALNPNGRAFCFPRDL